MTTCNNGACPCTIPRTYLSQEIHAYRTARREILLARGEVPVVVQAELDAQFHQTFYPHTESRPTCRGCRHRIEVHMDPQPLVPDLAKMAKLVDLLTIAYATTLIPVPTSVKTNHDPKFQDKLIQFYITDQCVFLGARFPKAARAKRFPCVGAHIYDHRMQQCAKSLGFEINSPRNGLPLFKSIEEKFDEGHIAIVPIAIQRSEGTDDTTTTLQILVCNELMDQVISVQRGKTKRDLTIGKGKHSIKRSIKFGDLHETTVVVSSPYLRALMLKQYMCYSQHPDEFPPPDLTLFGKSTSPQKSKDEVQAWIQSLQPPMPQSPVEKRHRDAQDVIPRKRRKKKHSSTRRSMDQAGAEVE